MRRINRKQKLLAQNYLPYAKVNIWPTAKNTKKQKNNFRRNTGFFSPELGIRLSFTKYPKLLYGYQTNKASFLQYKSTNKCSSIVAAQQWQAPGPQGQSFGPATAQQWQAPGPMDQFYEPSFTGNLQQSIKTDIGPGYTIKRLVQKPINKISFSSSTNMSIMYPFLKNAALVPGAHRIRKTKSYFFVQKNSVKTLSVWAKHAGKTKMRRFLEQRLNQSSAAASESGTFGYRNSLLFLTAIESLPIVLYIKSFQYKNSYIIYPMLQNKYLYINGFFIGQWASLKPGDIFSFQKNQKVSEHKRKAYINIVAPLYKKSLFVQSTKVLHGITGQTSTHKYKRFGLQC